MRAFREYRKRIMRGCLAWVLCCVPLLSLASPTDIVINEIMYNPPDDGTGIELEYLELCNRGVEDVDISGWYFSYGIAFVFPSGTVIEAGDYLVVCSDVMEMVSRYGIYNVVGPFSGKLKDEGELIELSDSSGIPIDDVEYMPGGEWPGEPDGNGPSLELVNP